MSICIMMNVNESHKPQTIPPAGRRFGRDDCGVFDASHIQGRRRPRGNKSAFLARRGAGPGCWFLFDGHLSFGSGRISRLGIARDRGGSLRCSLTIFPFGSLVHQHGGVNPSHAKGGRPDGGWPGCESSLRGSELPRPFFCTSGIDCNRNRPVRRGGRS